MTDDLYALKDILAIEKEGRRLERERCAALLGARGCWCEALNAASGLPASDREDIGHHPACPVALAAAIREGS